MSEQAVVDDTDASATQNVEGSGAQDDLDSLLAEFDGETKQVEQQSTEYTPDDLKQVVSFIKNQQIEKQQTEISEAMNSAVETMREVAGDVAKNLPAWALRGKLEELAGKDPRVVKAFENRGSNPQAWNKIVKSVGNELKSELESIPDKRSTEDQESVVAAVRSASSKTPGQEGPPNLNNMSDAEYNRYLQELGL